MKKSLVWVFGVLWQVGLVFSLSAAQPAIAPATRHSLWKVQSGTNALYLLGSVHVLKKSDYPLPVEIEAAYTNCRIVGFEADLGEVEGPDMAMKLLKKGSLPEGETLEKQLSPEVYRLFTNHVNDSGLPLFMFERFTPTLAAMTLAMMELQKMGMEAESGVDKHFYQRAKDDGKEIAAMETVEFQ